MGHIRNKVVTLQPQAREKNHVNVASLFFDRGSYLFFPALLFQNFGIKSPLLRKFPILQITYTKRILRFHHEE